MCISDSAQRQFVTCRNYTSASNDIDFVFNQTR